MFTSDAFDVQPTEDRYGTVINESDDSPALIPESPTKHHRPSKQEKLLKSKTAPAKAPEMTQQPS